MLTNLMTSLDKPYLNEFTSDLVVEILKACPDQLQWYLPSLKASLTPRPSPQWLNCVDFVIKVKKGNIYCSENQNVVVDKYEMTKETVWI